MNNRSNRYNNNQDPNARERQNDQLSFSDSWKQNVVELALLGGIVAGTATAAMNGNLGGLATVGKGTVRAVGKGFERYLDRSTGPVGRLAKRVGISTFKMLQKMPGTAQKFDQGLWDTQLQEAYNKIDPEEVQRLANERYAKARNEALKEYSDKNGGSDKGFVFYSTPHYHEEAVKNEMIEKNMRDQKAFGFDEPYAGKKDKKRNDLQGTPNGPGTVSQNILGSSLTGLGLGLGLTAAHGVDRAIRGWTEDDHQKRERNFNIAGSFLRDSGRSDFRKNASIHRNIHEGLAALGARVPQAVSTGLGYTAVSLGAAAALKHHKDLLVNTRHPDLLEEQHNNGPRVIIELGNQESSPNQMGGYTMSPHVASPEALGIAKLGGFKNFVKNVVGSPEEMRTLKNRLEGNTVNYKDEAAAALKGQDVSALTKEKFGDTGDAKDLLNSKADELRRHDFAKKDALESNIQRDQLIAGGGVSLGLLGGALAMHHARNKPKASE